MEDLINFEIPQENASIIKVIGVGGGGSNAVNHMYNLGIKDVNFVVCNTDAQALETSPVPVKIQLGESLTEGRGAGNRPEKGRQSAIENLDDVVKVLENNTKMVFITAGMGGGTGTGAAPIIAKTAKEMGILTVGIVTIPFRFEGKVRIKQALEGIAEMERNVDSLLIINNEKLRDMYGDLKLSNAFAKADNVLATAAKGIAEIITVHGYINVDFADVQTVMSDSGVAIMGSAKAEGEDRAIDAIQAALESPLLNNNDIRGARNILLNITSGDDEITMDEVGIVTDFVQTTVGEDASIIWGTGNDETLSSMINVTIIATGFGSGNILDISEAIEKPKIKRFSLDENGVSRKVEDDNSYGSSVSSSKEESFFDFKDDREETKSRVVDFGELERENERQIELLYKSSSKPAEKEKPIQESPTSYQSISNRESNFQKYKLSKEEMTDEKYIEELDNTPAYKRKNMALNTGGGNKRNPYSDVSRVNLKDGKDGISFSDDNPYLHDNVD